MSDAEVRAFVVGWIGGSATVMVVAVSCLVWWACRGRSSEGRR